MPPEVDMVKHFLAFALAIPLSGYCQSYAGSPPFRQVLDTPATAHVEGWSHGSIKANGVVIDLSESEPTSSSDSDQLWGRSIHSWVDKNKPAHVFHYYTQYSQLKVIFGYDLSVEPVQRTDQVRCTFSALTDPDELPEAAWPRDKYLPVVALPDNLTPLVVKSGDTISFTTLPLGEGKVAVIHYLRVTRMDSTPEAAQ
jgi:hypothetical protein